MRNLLVILFCSVTWLAAGQNSRSESAFGKVPVAVLGTFHFSNPGLDVVEQQSVKDVLSPQGQTEIEALLDLLEKFRPTKIVVEWDIKEDSLLCRRYEDFINDRFELSSNEIYQLGFKLGKRLGHPNIRAVDSPMYFAHEEDSLLFDDDYRSRYPVALRYDYEPFYRETDSLKAVLSLPDYLKLLNRADIQLKEHQAYLTKYAPVGAADNYVGADVVSNWYKRNLRIYANICRITDFTKDERILVVIGAGHSYLLNQFFDESPDYTVVTVDEILSGKQDE